MCEGCGVEQTSRPGQRPQKRPKGQEARKETEMVTQWLVGLPFPLLNGFPSSGWLLRGLCTWGQYREREGSVWQPQQLREVTAAPLTTPCANLTEEVAWS